MALGGESSILGYPTSDEYSTRDQIGRSSDFIGGRIVWKAGIEPRMIRQPILHFWDHDGGTLGPHGYPIDDGFGHLGGLLDQGFEHEHLEAYYVDTLSGNVVPDPGTMGTCNPHNRTDGTERDRIIQQWTIDGFGLDGKQSKLKCGNDSFSYWHIYDRHYEHWRQNADLMGVNWKKLLGLAIQKSVTGPLESTFDSNRGTFCYSGPIRTYNRVNDGKVTPHYMHPRIIMNASGDIITAFPTSTGCPRPR